MEVWTKPLGGGRTAALFINTQNKKAEADTAALTAEQEQGRSTTANGLVQLDNCNASRPSQQWSLSTGIHAGSGAITNVEQAAAAGTKAAQGWSIHACMTKPGMTVGIASSLKPLPKEPCTGSKNLCACNNAFQFPSNDTIVSAMDGQCLTTDAKSSKVTLEPCADTGADTTLQQWTVTAAADASAGFTIQSKVRAGMCIDSQPDGPVTPPCLPPKCNPGQPTTASVQLSDLGLGITGPVKIRDVWNKKDLPAGTVRLARCVQQAVCNWLSVFLL